MKSQSLRPDDISAVLRENARIFSAITLSGICILLMILVEMKFFGT